MIITDYRELPKRKIRYWLFRFKVESQGGASANGAPIGMREYFESHQYFIGWGKFNESKGWDLSEDNPLDIVPLRVGTNDAWNVELQKNSVPLPGTENMEEIKGAEVVDLVTNEEPRSLFGKKKKKKK